LQQDIISSAVKVEFFFHAIKLDFSVINSRMGIVATETRTKESFAFKEFAEDYWILSTGYEVSEDINVQLSKIMEMISKKKQTIKNICKQYDAKCEFLFVIKDYFDVVPAVYFEKDFLEFVVEIQAEFGIDFT